MELGVHFALSDSVAAELLDARGDDDKLGAVVEDIEETGRSEFSCDTDKAWDPILCALSSTGYERVSENWPAYGVILGDEDLNTDTDDQLVTYLAPDRVAEVSSYLAEITESEFGVRYDAMPLDDRNPEYGSDERGYAWGWLQEVANFFQRAARERRHVVFTVRF
ncbi:MULTISPECIES: DUF1877 family protein [Rhodococcus]|uniref:DUF1877 family protein n=1 Tax=Rhodococcus qingshengii TaxID=334542 RepID=A0A2A5JIF4_RHOSG|nr:MULTISPECIES: DUF1877 family protein [Rhodococcus]PCK29057.1 hypothetical protein CHR55_01320 [Rhodococcus qingshengii]